MKLSPNVSILVVACLLVGAPSHAGAARFLMSGPISADEVLESYVVEVSDPALIQEARDHLTATVTVPEQPLGYLVAHVRIASGADGVNRNHAEPGHPPWEWHVTELIKWVHFVPPATEPDEKEPNLHGSPSSVEDLLTADPPVEEMTLINYPLVMELSGDQVSNVINVSARGQVGSGENVMIAGSLCRAARPATWWCAPSGRHWLTTGLRIHWKTPR